MKITRAPKYRFLAVAGLIAAALGSASAEDILDSPAPPTGHTPEPEAEAQKEAEKVVRDVYKSDYAKKTPADQRALARKLLENGLATKNDPAARWVLLREARELAAQGGDAATALGAAAEAAKTFDVDGLALKTAALTALARAAHAPEAAAALVSRFLDVVDEAVAADRYDAAAALASKAGTVAKQSQDPALAATVQDRAREVGEQQREYQGVMAAEKTLETRPDDPEAHLAIGRYLCFVKSDWSGGLPMLARAGDPALKAAVDVELARPAETAEQVGAGDAWWEAADKERNALQKARLLGRARHWYEEALPRLSGLAKAKTESRLQACAEDSGAASGVRVTSVLLTTLPEPPKGHVLRAKWITDGGGGRTTDGKVASGRVEFFLFVQLARTGAPFSDVFLYNAEAGNSAKVAQPKEGAAVGYWDVGSSRDAFGTRNGWNVSLCVSKAKGAPVRDVQLGDDATWGRRGYVARGTFDGKTLWIRK